MRERLGIADVRRHVVVVAGQQVIVEINLLVLDVATELLRAAEVKQATQRGGISTGVESPVLLGLAVAEAQLCLAQQGRGDADPC